MLPFLTSLAGVPHSLGILDTQTVTVENGSGRWGYSTTLGIGSISDGTSNIYGGNNIIQFNWSTGGSLFLTITGSTNSGWSQVVIGGNTFLRTSASFSGSTWTWTSVSNPFGTTPFATVDCVFS